MRGPSVHTPHGSALRIFFLGGSTTENYRFNRPDTFPELVGRQVGAQLGRPVQVFNAAFSGATLQHSLSRFLHQVLDLEPDLVVVNHGVNDLLTGMLPEYSSDGRHLPPAPLASLRPTSFLLDWIRVKVQQRRIERAFAYGTLTPAIDWSHPLERFDFAASSLLSDFARRLHSLASLAEGHDVPVLLVTQPHLYDAALPESEKRLRFRMAAAFQNRGLDPPAPSLLAKGMALIHRVILSTPWGPNLIHFDLAQRTPRTWETFTDEVHLTRRGNRAVANALAEPIEQLLRSRTRP